MFETARNMAEARDFVQCAERSSGSRQNEGLDRLFDGVFGDDRELRRGGQARNMAVASASAAGSGVGTA
jgi:hypothetical protein